MRYLGNGEHAVFFFQRPQQKGNSGGHLCFSELLPAAPIVCSGVQTAPRARFVNAGRIRLIFASGARIAIVPKRRCEVTLEVDGARHTITVEAESVYHAAVLFYAHSAASPPGVRLPKVDMDTVLEVSPLYKVRLGDAMAWANAKANGQYKN